MLSGSKSYIEQKFQFLVKRLTWLNPNVLTLLGIIPPVLFFVFMQERKFVAALVMLFLTPLDMLDGMIARASGKSSNFGGFLDSTVDRISDFLLLAGFYAAGLASLSVTAGLVLATFLVSYTRSRAESATGNQQRFDIGLVERPERILFLILILGIYLLAPNAAVFSGSLTQSLFRVLLTLSIVTVLQRIWAAYKKL